MRSEFIETENYLKFVENVQELKELGKEEFNSAKIGLFYGNYGLGKTWSIEKLALQEKNNIIFLRAEQVWTKTYLIRKIGEEFGIENRSIAETSDSIKEHLMLEDRLIIVDEVDTLLTGEKYKLLEIFRDLTDQTSCTLIFIGMEASYAKWKKYSHYFSRVRTYKLEKNTEDDIKKFCELCEVTIEDDLVKYFARKYGNFRMIKRKLEDIEKEALLQDIENMDLKTYNKLGVENG